MTTLGIHAFMVADRARLDSFRAALAATLREDDVVVDVGAGVGVLGWMALELGARHVHAIEAGDSIALGRQIARANGFADRMSFVKARSTAVELAEPADLAVFDLFEIFGLNQGLLGVARDTARRLVKPGGTLVPRAIELHLAPLESPPDYAVVEVWSHPVGSVDPSVVRPLAANNLHGSSAGGDGLLAGSTRLVRIELGPDTDLAVEGFATFTCVRAGTLHGFLGWFEAELAPSVTVSNRPERPSSGYRRAFLPLELPVEVHEGDRVELSVWTHDGGPWRWRGGVISSDGEQRARFDHSTLLGAIDQRGA